MRGIVAPSMPSLSRTSMVAFSKRARDFRLRAWWAGSTVLGMGRFYKTALTKCKCEYTFTLLKVEEVIYDRRSHPSCGSLRHRGRSLARPDSLSESPPRHRGGRSAGQSPAVSTILR